MNSKINETEIKKVVDSIVNSINMSDLELYRYELNDRTSIFELFFDHYFREFEGMPCSHDKSVFVAKSINKYLLTGKNANLQITYKEVKEKGDNVSCLAELDNTCYWCPTTIKTSEEATAIFFNYLCMNTNFFEERKAKTLQSKEAKDNG